MTHSRRLHPRKRPLESRVFPLGSLALPQPNSPAEMHEENYFCNFLPVRRAHVRSRATERKTPNSHCWRICERFPASDKICLYIEIESGPDEQLFVYMTMSFSQRQLLPKILIAPLQRGLNRGRKKSMIVGAHLESWFIPSSLPMTSQQIYNILKRGERHLRAKIPWLLF